MNDPGLEDSDAYRDFIRVSNMCSFADLSARNIVALIDAADAVILAHEQLSDPASVVATAHAQSVIAFCVDDSAEAIADMEAATLAAKVLLGLPGR